MVAWYWVVVALVVGDFLGFLMAALVAANGRDND